MALLFFAITFFIAPAQAEYVPGRTRASAEGNLTATEASGIYRGIQEALVTQEETDGLGITQITLNLAGSTEIFTVKNIKRERCRDTILATSESKATLRLTDRSFTPCELRGERMWTIEVSQEDSRLLLVGDAEHYFLSQGGEHKSP